MQGDEGRNGTLGKPGRHGIYGAMGEPGTKGDLGIEGEPVSKISNKIYSVSSDFHNTVKRVENTTPS